MTYTALFTQLLRAEIELWDSLNAHLTTETPVSLPQYQALAAIAQFDGSARVQDISEAMSITVGATSKLVDRLERAGHAVRQSNPNDRRSSNVALTESGLASMRIAEVAVERHLRVILGASLSESRATELTNSLKTLQVNS